MTILKACKKSFKMSVPVQRFAAQTDLVSIFPFRSKAELQELIEFKRSHWIFRADFRIKIAGLVQGSV